MNDPKKDCMPWWRYGYVWLVISGPAVVVVAALGTAWIAVRYEDPVLGKDPYRSTAQTSRTGDKALLPAVQGRNHAASPVVVPQRAAP